VSQQTTNRYFDELASGLATGSISRGKALRLMGAALVGGTLTSFGIGGVAGADLCKPNGRACKKDSQCCSGTCSNGTCAPFNPNPECIGSMCGNVVPCSSSNPDCVCTTLATGGGFCVPGSTECGIVGQCGPNFECPEGSVCVLNTCCPDAPNQCAPLSLACESTTPATTAGLTPMSASSGPTFANR
jgi:hypothetical protein